jgi:hypothetical protein
MLFILFAFNKMNEFYLKLTAFFIILVTILNIKEFYLIDFFYKFIFYNFFVKIKLYLLAKK